jgi:hypothetical protein
MPREPVNGREPEYSDDDIQREDLEPHGAPGIDRQSKLTPQREKKATRNVDPGQTA